MKANSIILLLNIYNNNHLSANLNVMSTEVTQYVNAAHCITKKGEDIIYKIICLN